MKKIFLLISFFVVSIFEIYGDEFVQRKVSGEKGQHVAVTHFFFDGDNCYGARREYSNLRMHVHRPKIYWDLFYGGKLIATVDPDARSIDYMHAPEGTELTKHLSRFSLSKSGKLLSVWDLSHNKLSIISKEDLERLASKNDAVPEDFKRLQRNFRSHSKPPTIDEAKAKMKKANKS
jgi:hypothetical protein